MSDLDETPASPVASETVASETLPSDLTAFMYPTIGEGVTIYAKNQQEADALAAEHPLNKSA